MKKIVSLSLCLATLLWCEMFQSRHFELEKLADGVYAAIHRTGGHAICNAGIIDLGDKTIIFDTFLSPTAAQDLLAAVEQLKLSPIAYVINSHHHNDHIRGNQVFGDDVTIVSTDITRVLIEKHEPETIVHEKEYALEAFSQTKALMEAEKDPEKQKSHLMWLGYYEALVESHPILETRLPNLTTNNALSMYGSKREAQLICYGSGHTQSDLILVLPDEKIAFMGDLIFNEMHPFMADGEPEHWIEYLSKTQDLDIETVVPGHGPVATNQAFSTMIQYIEMIEAVAQTLIDGGKVENDIETLAVPSPFADWSFENFFRTNVGFMYKRLSDEQ